MAMVHAGASISPTKLEVVTSWLRGQVWCPADPNGLELIGSYRFDDPAGEVGIEALLVRLVDGSVVHLPLTYRAAPLPGADDFLVTTMTHTALGDRWVHEGAGDPVLVAAYVRAIVSGGEQAPVQYEHDGEVQTRTAAVTVRGSGEKSSADEPVEWIGAEVGRTRSVVHTSAGDLTIVHLLGAGDDAALGDAVLTGRFEGAAPVVLAGL